MVFSSSVFLIGFLPAVLLIYYVFLRRFRAAQNMFLFIASLCFYAWGEPAFVLVMLLSIVANWFFGLMVERYRKSKTGIRIVLVLTVVFNLVIIFLFKYLMFTLNTMNSVFGIQLPVPEIALPIGISFFTFQALSYVVDVYRRQGAVQKNPLNVGLYIAFFPQLIAGPIVRYETIAEQIQNRKETIEQFSKGATRFIAGLAKKVLIANNLALLADAAFETAIPELSTGFAWLGALAYSFQILFDFSGYSDMAIGLGQMFGFHFLENFNFPYISKSITEFWRRWHISLGTWFRDYVYFPLGGSRVKSKGRLVFNLFVVWLLTGLWHGANWTFICWGLLYFILLVIEKLTGLPDTKHLSVLKHGYTLLFVMIGWVLFRADTLGSAWQYLKVMIGLHSGVLWDNNTFFYLCENFMFLLMAVFFSIPILPWFSQKLRIQENKIIGILHPVVYLTLFLISMASITKGSYNPFIYFNF